MRKLTKKRLKHQRMVAMDKNGDKTPPFGESSSSDSDSSSSSKNNKSEVDSDLSDDDQKSKQQ